MSFSFFDKTKKFWALGAIFSDPACCSLPFRPSCLACEILFMDSPTMGMLIPEPAAGAFGAHSFKIVYAKQKLAATIIKTSQHYSERTLRWSSCSLQAPVTCSGAPASGSHSLSAKQGRDKSPGKLTREKTHFLPTDSRFLSTKGLFHLSQLLVHEMLLLSAPWHTHYSSLCCPPIIPQKRKYFLHWGNVIKRPWHKATFSYESFVLSSRHATKPLPAREEWGKHSVFFCWRTDASQ